MSSDHAAAARGLFASNLQSRAISACLVALIAFELAFLYSGAWLPQVLARTATLGFYVIAISRLGLRERLLVLVCLGLSAALVFRGESADIGRALDQAAFLAAFIQTMGLLREAAVRSAAIRDVGAYVTRQPAKRRTLAVLLGGQAMGVLLNFGALSLLGPLIQNGVRASSPDPEIARIREQRQLSALLRGFSWIVVWAPTTVTQALLADTLPNAEGAALAGLGLAMAVFMLALAWLEDQAAWRATAARLRAGGRVVQETPRLPRGAARNLVGICALLIGTTLTIRWLTGVPTVPALMLTAPICLVLWIMVQRTPEGLGTALRSVGHTLRDVAGGAVPNGARECATLGASGFIGVAAAALVPVDTVAAWLGVVQPDPAVLLIVLPLLIVVAGQIALSPIMMVVFLASIISALPEAPADHTLIAFALSCGWAITMTASPNAAGALIMARVTGRGAYELTWRWNLRFSLLAYGALGIAILALVRLW